MRKLTVQLILLGALALGGPVYASDMYVPKQTTDELKAVCDKVGGKFSQDSNGYECGTDCHGKVGTDCTVFCRTGGRCVAQVIGGRRPHNALSALQVPEHKAR